MMQVREPTQFQQQLLFLFVDLTWQCLQHEVVPLPLFSASQWHSVSLSKENSPCPLSSHSHFRPQASPLQPPVCFLSPQICLFQTFHTHTPSCNRYPFVSGFFHLTFPRFILMVKLKSFSRVRLFVTLWTVAYQCPPTMGYSRQEYWSGLPFPSPGELPNPGIEPRDQSRVSRIGDRCFNLWATREAWNRASLW